MTSPAEVQWVVLNGMESLHEKKTMDDTKWQASCSLMKDFISVYNAQKSDKRWPKWASAVAPYFFFSSVVVGCLTLSPENNAKFMD
jgi:hypothetical protein